MKQQGCLIVICLCWLTACSSLIERQMATHTGMRGAVITDFGQTERRLCLDDDVCVRVTDWGELKQIENGEPLTELKLRADIYMNEAKLELDETFEFSGLTPSAPLLVIFPGYGMRADHMGMMALFMRSQGVQPLVVASPTEQDPFNFGVQGARDLAAIIAERYTDREVYLLGFSLGSLAVAEFSRIHQPAGAMVLAPLLDFDASAQRLIAMHRRSSVFARVIPPQSYADGLQKLVKNSQVDPAALTWGYAVEHLPDDSLVLGSTHDTLSRFAELEYEVRAQGREFTMIEFTQTAYLHPVMAMPLPDIQAAIRDWLNAQSQ
ncbi:hypothetical protein CWE12_12040 [Aliidiomarina sedimenti]|uniref:AB hydrolase-1 domain-containing protein n=1 Tax=Aliidiomarina sedimenti TaxID=1933879 RepID=A0ABY0BXP9_9GAMM|nr:alpha/beta hydrolase [Aliidiomarina sedimenti]RUO29008.1 hypothetical protein CWE12_12040 [Aliidiomarina sedimenti]